MRAAPRPAFSDSSRLAPSPRDLARGAARSGRAALPRAPLTQRQRAAIALGSERRRLFLATTAISLLAPLVPYLTGAWETGWYALAVTPLPFLIRTVVFLLVVHLLLALVLLPLSWYGGFVLAHRFKLSTQSGRAWAAEWLKASLVGILFGTLLGAAFIASVFLAGDGWWWVFGLITTGALVLLTVGAPYVLLPLFFHPRPLADAATAQRIEDLARSAGARVRSVSSLDFSRRTQEANAAVLGLGPSLRVVIADTLLAQFGPDEVDAVVAHELGHYVHRDVPRLLAVNLALLWAGLLVAWRLAPAAEPLLSLPSLGYVPGYPELLCVAELFALLTSPLTSALSRHLESAADRFALQLTRDPIGLANALAQLAEQNLAELWPPRWAELLWGSHPALGRRIAAAEAYRG